MSTRINKNIPFALAAMGGISLNAESPHVIEGLLNDYTVSNVMLAQVDDMGRCVMVVECQAADGPVKLRAVASSNGDVKLFKDLASAQALILRARFALGAGVTFYRKEKTRTLGDPIAALKALYKSFKAEKLVGDTAGAKIVALITAGTALGWNTAVGTPEAYEFADYLEKQATVAESVLYAAGRITALAASLTAAGIDPATVV